MKRLAYFVSPHGFGHAARACAVVTEMWRRHPRLQVHLFTTVPRWFFEDSLEGPFVVHELDCDVGLVQRSPLVEDLDATVDRLRAAPLWQPHAVRSVAEGLFEVCADVVVADISPLGLAAGRAAGKPTVLVENFTWDWIYEEYPEAPAELRSLGRKMAAWFDRADMRIQAEPSCREIPGASTVSPVARRRRLGRSDLRRALGVPDDEPMVLVSMGGVAWDTGPTATMMVEGGPWVVVPGGTHGAPRRWGHLVQLPFHSQFFHPDLVAASDVVVGKLGYSTVAEAFTSGTALAWIGRPRFPESPVLGRWVTGNMVAEEMEENALDDGSWLETVNTLLGRSRPGTPAGNGAAEAAEMILGRFAGVAD
ncbi:MAG: hypothetical protein PVG92_00735 [Holophagae bacterium]